MPATAKTRRGARGLLAGARGPAALLAVAVAIVALFAARYGATAQSPASDWMVEQVQQVIADTLAGDHCTTPSAALTTMRSALDQHEFTEWALHAGADLSGSACVTATIDGQTRRVVLIPALRPEVRSALQRVTEDLYKECLSKDAAIARLSATLRDLGEQGFEVRTDGPVTAPVERRNEVFSHVDQGCWIYSGTGWTADGLRLYYVVGK